MTSRAASAPRRAVLLLAALVSVMALAACGTSTSGTASAPTSQAWSYTDALGHTVTLAHRPTRVAGLNDVIVSLLEYGVKPVASFGYSSIGADQRFAGLDTKGIVQVGTSYGQINLEKLAEARPQLIITDVYPVNAKGTIDRSQADYGFENMQQQQEIAKIAPVVTIYMGGNGASVVAQTTKLAQSLGAKPSVIAAAKATFEAAKTNLHQVATHSKVVATALYADSDGVDVAKPADDPALRMYQDDGVKMTVPTAKGYYWADYSWENATKVGGDLLLLEQSGYDVAALQKQPTFAGNAALKAGQIHPWESSGMDYVQQAAFMNKLAGLITASRVLTASAN
jgi:iron complex transport system substrate-binding protein